MNSNHLRSNDSPTQERLPLAPWVNVDPAVIARQNSMLAAVKHCISLAGLEGKELYLELGIDAGHWSKIMAGKQAHFPIDKLTDLMTMCGNEAPLIWLVLNRGYDPHSLRKLETETERKLRIAEDELAKERNERAIERRAMRALITGIAA